MVFNDHLTVGPVAKPPFGGQHERLITLPRLEDRVALFLKKDSLRGLEKKTSRYFSQDPGQEATAEEEHPVKYPLSQALGPIKT